MSTSPSKSPPSSNTFLLIFGAIMLVGIMFMAWMGRAPAIVTVGKLMPPIDLKPLLDGTEPISREQLLGKLTVIHFWGTWCPPCKAEFPQFVKLAVKFSNNPDVVIVSVSCSQGPEYDLEELRRQTYIFMSGYGRPIPTYSDPAAMTRQQFALMLPNGSLGYPTTVLIDREGKIVELLNGYLPGDMEKLSRSVEQRL